MNIKNSRILVLGGWGLVGVAVCKRLLAQKPSYLAVLSLREHEAKDAVSELQPFRGGCEVVAEWGDIFLTSKLKDHSRPEILDDADLRRQFVDGVFEKPSEDRLKSFFLYQIIAKHKPDIIIDSVNSATGLAYQDTYTAYYDVREAMDSAGGKATADSIRSQVEKLVSTISIPQLIRHLQVLNEACRTHSVRMYVKVGTTGTGGMGLNIPYTHSEDRPSGQLLSKSSLAGAHSLLLFLMGRTPGSPYVKEIKPAAVIAWKKIAYGEIRRGGKPIPLFDCDPQSPVTLGPVFKRLDNSAGTEKQENLKAVYIDTGENGIFSTEEFFTITAAEQMEFVTPEEIAHSVVTEIEGGNSGFDVVGALDAVVMGPTYRAGILRKAALDEMVRLEQKSGSRSIAFEMLGPPHLSKLLYEAYLIWLAFPNVLGFCRKSENECSEALLNVVKSNDTLRATILSIGVPILLPDGKQILRGPEVKIPPYAGSNEFKVDDTSLNEWAKKGWVDLRPANMKLWQQRIEKHLQFDDEENRQDSSSGYPWPSRFEGESDSHFVGKIVTQIFIDEENGGRIKA
ncbi:MAG: short-chain dehydrogenase [Calditrichaeota bacterium]|nr:short-chain dehydrogenase [Calditrichota bacterium]MCB9368227.1 short-chain dehydrogenase [Calditrichota bacterium]